MADQWISAAVSAKNLTVANNLLVGVPSGQTILRILYSWGFSGFCSSWENLMTVAANLVYFGLQTTVGNGSEVPASPAPPAGNADPPTQRFLAWEARAPELAAYDGHSGTVFWRDAPRREQGDVHGQVLATGIPAGDALNLWSTVASVSSWPTSGLAQYWVAVRVLTRPAT